MQREACIDDGRHGKDQHPGSLNEDALKPLEPRIDLLVPLGADRFMAAKLCFKAHGWLSSCAAAASAAKRCASRSAAAAACTA